MLNVTEFVTWNEQTTTEVSIFEDGFCWQHACFANRRMSLTNFLKLAVAAPFSLLLD